MNALRAFEAAARLGGFAIAAQELSVTAGAVSRHVRLLEDRTGVPLFERRPRSLVLTPRGHDLLGIVSESFDRLETGTRAVLAPTARARLHAPGPASSPTSCSAIGCNPCAARATWRRAGCRVWRRSR